MARYTIRFIENHEEKVTPPIMHKEGEVMRNVREGTMRHFCDKGVAEIIKEVPEPAPKKAPVEKKVSVTKVDQRSFASQAAPASQPKTAPKQKAKPKSL